jgi:hypothetical protein
MRPSSLGYILLGVLVFAATYRILNEPPFPKLPSEYDPSRAYLFEQKSGPLPTYKDESRLQDGDLAPANVNSDELATVEDKAQLEDRNQSPTNQPSDLKDVKLADRESIL